jgi:hypothetical protein
MASKQMLALAAAIILAFLPMIASETVHPVGDAKGWTLGFDYTTWSESKQFRVSDTLRKHSISLFFSKEIDQFHSSEILCVEYQFLNQVMVRIADQNSN